MNRQIRWGVIAVVVLAILMVIYFVRIAPRESESPVRIGYLSIVASLPLFVAVEKGFLTEEGIEYETMPVASSNQLVDAVIAGNLDCYIESSALPVLAVHLQSPGKIKVFSVSEITSQSPFDAILTMEDAPVEALSDLEGRRIGVFPGTTATNLLKKYLSDRGIDVSTIVFVPMPPANHLAALVEGSVDAIHAYEPTTSIALSRGGIRQLYGSVYADMISPNPQGVAAVGTAFLQQRAETAAKVISALERAMAYMKEHDSDARRILAKWMELPEEVADTCVFLYMLPHDQINVPVFQQYADMLTELGELDGHVRVDDLVYSK